MSITVPAPRTTSSDDLGPGTILASWLLTALAALFLSARIGAKLWTGRGLWVDDYVLIVAWVCCILPALGPLWWGLLLLLTSSSQDNPPRTGHNINFRCLQRPWKACLQYHQHSISGTFAQCDCDYPHHRSGTEQDLLCNHRTKDRKRMDESNHVVHTCLNQCLPGDQRCYPLGQFQPCPHYVCPQSQPW